VSSKSESQQPDEEPETQPEEQPAPKRKPQPSPLKPGAIQLFGVKEAAVYCGLVARTIKYHIYESGELQADALIGHSLVFTQATLDEFLSRRRPPGRPKAKEDPSPPASGSQP
jgi:hypothetical protein